jgi:hypothetical protein
MAKASKSTSTKRPAAKTSKPGRKIVATAKKVKTSKPNAVETKAKARAKVATKAKVAPAPKLTIGELRTKFAKIENANATLRAKNREGVRFLKAAEQRIAELEVQVSALEKKVAKSAHVKPAPTKAAPTAVPAAKRQTRVAKTVKVDAPVEETSADEEELAPASESEIADD